MNQRGSASIVGLLVVFAATSMLLTVVILFATGIAQETILPRLRARAASAAPVLPAPVEAPAAEAAAQTGGSAQADSLRALRAQLRIEQEELAARTAALEQRISDWQALQEEQDASDAQRIAGMARIYSSMKPEAAARVLVRLDDATFEQVVAKLDKRAAGKILALIDPDRVARLVHSSAPAGLGAES